MDKPEDLTQDAGWDLAVAETKNDWLLLGVFIFFFLANVLEEIYSSHSVVRTIGWLSVTVLGFPAGYGTLMVWKKVLQRRTSDRSRILWMLVAITAVMLAYWFLNVWFLQCTGLRSEHATFDIAGVRAFVIGILVALAVARRRRLI